MMAGSMREAWGGDACNGMPPGLDEPRLPAAMDSEAGAVLSRCGSYRWLAWQIWTTGPVLLVITLCPGVSGRQAFDCRDRAIAHRASRLGFAGVEIASAYAARVAASKDLERFADPIGVENDPTIRWALRRVDVVACAWGRTCTRTRESRLLTLLARAGHQPHTFGVDASGRPLHQLYTPYDAPMQPFRK